jgi:signal recognition particle subunit SEC65
MYAVNHHTRQISGKITKKRLKLLTTAYPDTNLDGLTQSSHRYPEIWFNPNDLIVCERKKPEHTVFQLVETAVIVNSACKINPMKKPRAATSNNPILARKQKSMLQKVRRLESKSKRMKILLKDLQKKKVLDAKSVKVLNELYGSSCGDLIANQSKNLNKSTPGLRYDENIRSFALSVHYHSAQAYNLLRYV